MSWATSAASSEAVNVKLRRNPLHRPPEHPWSEAAAIASAFLLTCRAKARSASPEEHAFLSWETSQLGADVRSGILIGVG